LVGLNYGPLVTKLPKRLRSDQLAAIFGWPLFCVHGSKGRNKASATIRLTYSREFVQNRAKSTEFAQMAGTRISFTVTKEAAAYLRWFARTILLEEDENDGARHLMLVQLEAMRRAHRDSDPSLSDLPAVSEANKT